MAEEMFNADQRDSHPPPFVFIAPNGRPYKAARWGGEWWFFYWNDGSKSWVSKEPASPAAMGAARVIALPDEQAKLYDDLHAKSQR